MPSDYLIYKHTCTITCKSYIGQTNDYKRRMSNHLSPTSRCYAFHNAINKHGWNTFATEFLATNLTLEQANVLEERFITEHNTLSPKGYNLKGGGTNRLFDRKAYSKEHYRKCKSRSLMKV